MPDLSADRLSRAHADLGPRLAVHGLDATVRIRRDALGVAHVEATSVQDLFLGQGFAIAQDRLWQLEWDRRRALGRTAELAGTPANVVADGFHRRARLADHARAGYAALDGATRAVVDAHAAGINAYLAACTVRPVEYQALGISDLADEPWEGWHAIAIFLVRHVTFATFQMKLWNARVLAALGPDAVSRFRIEGSTGDTAVIVPPGVRAAVGALDAADWFDAGTGHLDELQPLGLQMSGSNAWAVGGARTRTGLPLVAGDPHRPFEVPNVYAQVHLVGPDIDVAGFSFVGVPGIQHFAQTPHVAWAVTNAMADYQDLFVERLPEAITDVRTEQIAVRGGDPVTIECAVTVHGPVVIGGTAHGVGVALASTGLVEAGGSLRTILPMFSARTVADLDALLQDWVEPANNFVLADTQGHIAYRTAGRIPVRHRLNQILPVPGWDPAHDWAGCIPDADLPRATDPDGAAIVTANQRITTGDLGQQLNWDAAPPHRAERIWARLAEQPSGMTVADHAAIHTDCVSLPFADLARRVVDASLDPVASSVLRGWDGAMDAGSAAAALTGTIGHVLCELVVDLLPAPLRTNPFAAWEPPATALPPAARVSAALKGWLAADDTTITGGSTWADLIAKATQRAVEVLTARHGGDPSGWTWGALHAATPAHPLRGLTPELDALVTPTSGPLSGGADCVMAMNQVAGITTNAVVGSTARYVWDLADRASSGWVVPLGVSGDPGDAHFRDQTASWSAGRLHPVFDASTTNAVELHPR